MALVKSEDKAGHKVIGLENGDVLMEENTKSDGLFIVKEGKVGVYKKNKMVGEINSGSLVGEMSFLDNKPRSATVKALGKCVVLEISSQKFQETFNSQPDWFQTLVKTLVERLRSTTEKVQV